MTGSMTAVLTAGGRKFFLKQKRQDTPPVSCQWCLHRRAFQLQLDIWVSIGGRDSLQSQLTADCVPRARGPAALGKDPFQGTGMA